MPEIPIRIPASDTMVFMAQAAKDEERFGANSDPDRLDADAAAAAAAAAAPAPKAKTKTKHSVRASIKRFGLKVRTKSAALKAATASKTSSIKAATKPANERTVAAELKTIHQHFVCLEHEVARLERGLEQEHERVRRLMRRVQTLETILHKEGRCVADDA